MKLEKRYNYLDGIRAYACIGIILMHVLTNGYPDLKGVMFTQIIPAFTNFTFLFMLLSAFSMCCGYFERFKNGTINLNQFYMRRYQRIWPFFAILCTMEMLIEHSMNSVYEWLADITLAFGLIPQNGIEVVGVGWFIGTIFVFYMLFPFFVFLITNKRRAWFALLVCLTLHFLCIVRFKAAWGRDNIVFSSIFFLAGGLIYLYRENLVNSPYYKWISLGISIAIVIIMIYTSNNLPILYMILFSSLIIIGISSNGHIAKILLQNRFVIFVSGISMEMYLCHMFIYRAFEKMNLLHLARTEVINYTIIAIGTLSGAICFSMAAKKIIELMSKKKNMHEWMSGVK